MPPTIQDKAARIARWLAQQADKELAQFAVEQALADAGGDLDAAIADADAFLAGSGDAGPRDA